MKKDERFEKFCEVLAEHPGISAAAYDRLSKRGRPARRPLETRFGCSWSELVSLAEKRYRSKANDKTKKVGMTRSSFMKEFDDTARIREVVRSATKTLTSNFNSSTPEDDVILSEFEFRVDWCGNVPAPRFGRVAREEEFSKYRFRSKGKIFWTTPRTKKWALENVSSAREL